MAGYVIFDERGSFEGFTNKNEHDGISAYVPVGPVGEAICKKDQNAFAKILENPSTDFHESFSVLFLAFLCNDKKAVEALLNRNIPPLTEVEFSNVCIRCMPLLIDCLSIMYDCEQISPAKANIFLIQYILWERTKDDQVVCKVFGMKASPNVLYTFDHWKNLHRPLLFHLVNNLEIDMLTVFIENGANLNVKNEKGISLLRSTAELFMTFASDDRARERKKLIALLQKHHAKFHPALTFKEQIKFWIFGRL